MQTAEYIIIFLNWKVFRQQGLFLLGLNSQDTQAPAFPFTLSPPPVPRIKSDWRNMSLPVALISIPSPFMISILITGTYLFLKLHPYMSHCFIIQMKPIRSWAPFTSVKAETQSSDQSLLLTDSHYYQKRMPTCLYIWRLLLWIL